MWIPRKSIQAEFHSPAHIDEEVAVQAHFSRVGTSSITIQFEAYRASDRAHRASGTLVVVAVDKATMKPRPIPDVVKAKLSPYAR